MAGRRINRMHLLPKSLLRDVNDAIDKGAGVAALRQLLKTRYEGPLRVDGYVVLSSYITEYKAAKKLPEGAAPVESAKQSVPSVPAVLNTNWDWSDKKKILQELGNWCRERIENLKQASDLTPGEETALVRYFSEIRNIIEALAKLSGELSPDEDQKVVVNFINENIYGVMSVVAAAVKEVYGEEKLLIFKAALKKKFQEARSAIDVVKVLEEGKVDETNNL